MCIDWHLVLLALSAIGTVGAVIVALFITKWQDRINNRKDVKIKWRHLRGQITFDGFQDGRDFDNILISFVNTGNRKVIIQQIKFLFEDGTAFGYLDLMAPTELDMTLPCSLEIEEARTLRIPRRDFGNFIEKAYSEKKIGRVRQEIVLVAVDTTDKKYRCETGYTYIEYVTSTLTNREIFNAK